MFSSAQKSVYSPVCLVLTPGSGGTNDGPIFSGATLPTANAFIPAFNYRFNGYERKLVITLANAAQTFSARVTTVNANGIESTQTVTFTASSWTDTNFSTNVTSIFMLTVPAAGFWLGYAGGRATFTPTGNNFSFIITTTNAGSDSWSMTGCFFNPNNLIEDPAKAAVQSTFFPINASYTSQTASMATPSFMQLPMGRFRVAHDQDDSTATVTIFAGVKVYY